MPKGSSSPAGHVRPVAGAFFTPRDDADERGFTLIELMIVVAIIAILAGILIPNFVNARAQAQTSACESNLRAIATAMELYYADNQRYPDAGAVPDALNATGVVYLNNTPRDPADAGATPSKYTFTQPTGDGQSYLIVCPGTHAPSTLAKINKDDGSGKVSAGLCGTQGCVKSIEYESGTGLLAK
jgi:type II secretion system protein G